MIDWLNWLPVMAAGTIAGSSCGLLGVHVVGMRIPFVAVCVSHAAMAGAVFASLGGIGADHLHWPAMAAAMATALLLGLLDSRGVRLDTNVLIGALFALSMGLAFLGIGLFSILGKPDNDVRNLMWGNLAFCRWQDVRWMLLVLLLQVGFVAVFAKELRAILFGRSDAAAMGIAATAVWIGFLLLISIILSVHFQAVGGLLIYSLLINPAAAAFLLARRHGHVLAVSTILGAASGLGGFMLSAITDLPTGAVIVITSAILLLAAGTLPRLASRIRLPLARMAASLRSRNRE
jgi:manganese/iron transport system permease protein